MVTPLRIADTGSPGSNLFLILCLNFIIFYWRIIALQCFVSFFCTTIYGISYTCTYIPSLLYLPPTSRPANPSRSSQSNRAELPVLYSSFPLAIYFTQTCTHMLYYYQHPGMWGRLKGQKLESETSEEPGYRCCSSRFFPVALLILGRGCRSLKCTLELRFKTTGFRSLMAKIANSNACKGQAAKVTPSR